MQACKLAYLIGPLAVKVKSDVHWIIFTVVLSVLMLSVVMLSVIVHHCIVILSVIFLSIAMLSVPGLNVIILVVYAEFNHIEGL
jgi:hypothetical protein